MSHATAQAAVRACVSAWQYRTLRVQDRFELERSLALLELHEARLPDYTAHAVRLLKSMRAELASRPPEPVKSCRASRHTLPEDAKPGLVRCLVCHKRVQLKTIKKLTAGSPALPVG